MTYSMTWNESLVVNEPAQPPSDRTQHRKYGADVRVDPVLAMELSLLKLN